MKVKKTICLGLPIGFLWLVASCMESKPVDDLINEETLLPENHLDEDSNVWEGSITEDVFRKVIETIKASFMEEAVDRGEGIVINGYWDSTKVNAGVKRIDGKLVISVHGGLARRSEISPGALALALCHEIGHAYGGVPYIILDTRISAEGQADYFGAGACLKRVLPLIAGDDAVAEGDIDREVIDSCASDAFCERRLYSSLRLSQLFAAAKNEGYPRIDTPDTTVARSTILSYPPTVQCRFDTYYNATLSKQRPSCWFRQLVNDN